jgi:hypothetical protein
MPNRMVSSDIVHLVGGLDATGGLGQARDLAGLLGRAIGEQVVQVFAVALFLAELFADGLGQHAHSWSDLVLVVVLAQES